MNTPIVVCASDENFSRPLMVTLISLNENSSQKIVVYIMDGGISRKTKMCISSLNLENIELKYVPINNKMLPKLKTSAAISIASYYRLLIPQLLPQKIKKVVYLDCDVIIKKDITILYNLDMENKAICAVAEMAANARYVSSPRGLKLFEQLGIKEYNKYFNAGVLLINLDKWRQKDICDKIINYLIKYDKYVLWHDQDGLNAILWNDWKELDPRWNVMTALYLADSWQNSVFNREDFYRIKSNPYIIHFTNKSSKPWLKESNHPYKSLYNKYLQIIEHNLLNLGR